MKNTKRILFLIIVLTMCFSLLPTSAFAEEERVRVEFVCEPMEAAITVYEAERNELDELVPALDKGGEPVVMEPEKDGSYLLLSGTYLYDASSAGYKSIDKAELTVQAPADGETAQKVNVTLNATKRGSAKGSFSYDRDNAVTAVLQKTYNEQDCTVLVGDGLIGGGINNASSGGLAIRQFEWLFKNGYATVYKVKCASDGRILYSENSIIEKGDVIFYSCGKCGGLLHVELVSGIENGYVKRLGCSKGLSNKYNTTAYYKSGCGDSRPYSTFVAHIEDQIGSSNVGPNQFFINFNGNEKRKDGDMESVILSFEIPYVFPECRYTAEGYYFHGWELLNRNLKDGQWFYSETGWGSQSQERVFLPGEQLVFDKTWNCHWFTIRPVWSTEPMVVISYDPNGGTVPVQSKSVDTGSTYGDLPTPVREDYSFDGWFTEPEGGTLITSSSLVSATEDHTLYAHWTRSAVTVTFVSDGNAIQAGKYILGQTYSPLPSPMKSGYSFTGWYTQEIEGAAIIPSTVVTNSNDHSLYAHWEKSDGSGSEGYAGFLGSIQYTTKSDGTLKITYCNILTFTGDVVLPSEINGRTCTELDTAAILNCNGLTSLFIPDSYTTLNPSAIASNSNLKSVRLPEGLQTIPYALFLGCTSLEEINIPNSVTSIGLDAFKDCSSLKRIVIPQNVVSLGQGAFSECTSLEKAHLPDGLKNIGSGVFAGCTSLKRVNLPVSMICKEYSIFGDCPLLTVAAPIGDEGDFTNILYSWTESIPTDAFSNITSLETVVFPSGIKTIGAGAFAHCTSLKGISIPRSVETVGGYAFRGCTALKNVTVYTDTQFGNCVFMECPNITSAGPLGSDKDFEFEWTNAIPDKAFAWMEGLQSVLLPGGVESIGSEAFMGTSISTISIPETVIFIGDSAFKDCSELTGLELPSGITEVNAGLFGGCTKLTTVDIPEGVQSIGAGAFSGCSSLTDITIPEGITTISAATFENCIALTGLTLPESVATIGSYAFSGCQSIDNFVVSNNVQTISYHAFDGCSNLRTVTLPLSLLTVGEGAFSNCPLLGKVYYLSSSIDWDGITFAQNNGLESAEIIYCGEGGVLINESTFPDDVFRAFVLEKLDTDKKGYFTTHDLAGIKRITCNSLGIQDLTGIEAFTSLEYLDCRDNKLCRIDISKNTKLETLICVYQHPDIKAHVQESDSQYLVDLGYFAGNSNRITGVVHSEYNHDTGIAAFSIPPRTISYLFDTGISENLMDVTIYTDANVYMVSFSLVLPEQTADDFELLLYDASLDRTAVQEDAEKEEHLLNSSVYTTQNICYWDSSESTYLKDCSVDSVPPGNYVLVIKHPSYETFFADISVSANVEMEPIYLQKRADVSIEISSDVFPDAVFLNYVSQSYDSDHNGALSADELASVTQINVANMGISSLLGIENFTKLEELNCCFNNLQTLDASKNTNLLYLYCYGNQLTELNVSGCSSLIELICGTEVQDEQTGTYNTYGNKLLSLDVSHNPALQYFYCAGNELTALNVGNNPSLIELGCWANALTALDLSANTSLEGLYCGNNPLLSLNVINNTKLVELYCQSDRLSTLDITKNPVLAVLVCWDNALTSLNISNNSQLSYLDCGFNNIAELDVSACPLLEAAISNGTVSTFENGIMLYNSDDAVLYCDINTSISNHFYAVTYDANGGTGAPATQIKTHGTALTLSAAAPTCEGWFFLGWAETADAVEAAYLPGDSYVRDASMTLHAVWAKPDFVLPSAITAIDSEAFSGGAFICVKLPDNAISIGWHAFANCPNLAYIYIPTSTTQIDDEAFGNMQGLTIIGKTGTAAETYARNRNYSFISLP